MRTSLWCNGSVISKTNWFIRHHFTRVFSLPFFPGRRKDSVSGDATFWRHKTWRQHHPHIVKVHQDLSLEAIADISISATSSSLLPRAHVSIHDDLGAMNLIFVSKTSSMIFNRPLDLRERKRCGWQCALCTFAKFNVFWVRTRIFLHLSRSLLSKLMGASEFVEIRNGIRVQCVTWKEDGGARETLRKSHEWKQITGLSSDHQWSEQEDEMRATYGVLFVHSNSIRASYAHVITHSWHHPSLLPTLENGTFSSSGWIIVSHRVEILVPVSPSHASHVSPSSTESLCETPDPRLQSFRDYKRQRQWESEKLTDFGAT